MKRLSYALLFLSLIALPCQAQIWAINSMYTSPSEPGILRVSIRALIGDTGECGPTPEDVCERVLNDLNIEVESCPPDGGDCTYQFDGVWRPDFGEWVTFHFSLDVTQVHTLRAHYMWGAYMDWEWIGGMIGHCVNPCGMDYYLEPDPLIIDMTVVAEVSSWGTMKAAYGSD